MNSINKLIKTIKKLRSKDGCEWDREQTHDTLVPYLLEETYEVICNTGFTVSGSSTMICGTNGTFNQTPMCQGKI